jgi:hypothetical protein
MVTIHSIYILCARWVLFVTPDSSSRLPRCSMMLLPSPLLVINCLSCSPLGGPGPPPFPPTRVDPISFRLQAPSRFPVGHKYNPTTQTTSMLASYMNRSFTDSIGSFKVFVLYNVKVYCPNWRSQLQWEVIELSGQLIPHP